MAEIHRLRPAKAPPHTVPKEPEHRMPLNWRGWLLAIAALLGWLVAVGLSMVVFTAFQQ